MEAKHSLGPLVAILECRGGGISHAIFHKDSCYIKDCLDEDCVEFTVLDTPDAEVATVHFNSGASCDDGNGGTGKAYAHLFSAAPDLLEALEEVVDYQGGADSPLDDPHVMARINAAISKAKGE